MCTYCDDGRLFDACANIDLTSTGCTVVDEWWQAQWEYRGNTEYEPYPDEINVIIENAYQNKKPYAEWEEENARYRLTFETMEEEMANDASSKVKVRRITKGKALLTGVSFSCSFGWFAVEHSALKYSI